MLARTPRRKRKTVAVRRADDRRRKNLQLDREKLGLRRCTLWISDAALAGIITQLVMTGQLSDEQAMDHHKLEAALAALIEKQGAHWAR
jgi:hypothetical protein